MPTVEQTVAQLQQTNAELVTASDALTNEVTSKLSAINSTVAAKMGEVDRNISEKMSAVDDSVNTATAQVSSLITHSESYNPTTYTSIPLPSSGWIRLGEFGNRGAFTITLATVGGAHAPMLIEMKIFKDYTNIFQVVSTAFGFNHYVTDVRLQNNAETGLGDKTFVEINLATHLDYLHVQIQRQPLFDATFKLYTDTAKMVSTSELWSSEEQSLTLGVSSNLPIQ
ncbi:hypothetical protein [Pseudoalteromonas sp. MMG012]|uniref:hypothetical protein n=1 Tax=Pseudoalteromonas sp. MMG012 TaxID=2822686 RepID=UPI001B3A4899|nr:hypothetical protein [Pseudoalteromonas sp. MMG012]MBQ4852694.1 hypothetical protein [Pseudoalteromonas sp. MMG012]